MFTSTTRVIAAAAATVLLGFGVAPAAHADEVPTDSPCAAQEAKVAKAEDALARVAAVFANKKDRVADAQAAVDAATTEKELAKAERGLAKAQVKVTEVKKEKKAQKQRLAKAETRLTECEAAQSGASPLARS